MRRYGRKKNTVVQSNDPASFDILIENPTFVTRDGQPVFKAHRDASTNPLQNDKGKTSFVKGTDGEGNEIRTEVSVDNLMRKPAGSTSAAPAVSPPPPADMPGADPQNDMLTGEDCLRRIQLLRLRQHLLPTLILQYPLLRKLDSRQLYQLNTVPVGDPANIHGR